MKKSGIYTQKGDQGQTSLIGGTRTRKNDTRIEAYGTIDELNSWMGRLRAQTSPKTPEWERLHAIQVLLFRLGAILATDDTLAADARNPRSTHAEITTEDVHTLEGWIDEMDAQLPLLREFVIPGDNARSADAHIARTVCRRAERRIISLAELSEQPATLLAYVNRLSDYLFVLSRLWAMEEKVV